jgi:hypothetical protein
MLMRIGRFGMCETWIGLWNGVRGNCSVVSYEAAGGCYASFEIPSKRTGRWVPGADKVTDVE